MGPDLLRGARAVLGWSSIEAGRRAGVSVSTVVSAEGRGAGACSPSPSDLDRLRRAYEAAGVRLIEGGSTGRGLRIGAR